MDIISKLIQLIIEGSGCFYYPDATQFHPDFEFLKSSRGKVLIVRSRDREKLLELTEELISRGYELSGGIQEVRWSSNTTGNRATFLCPK